MLDPFWVVLYIMGDRRPASFFCMWIFGCPSTISWQMINFWSSDKCLPCDSKFYIPKLSKKKCSLQCIKLTLNIQFHIKYWHFLNDDISAELLKSLFICLFSCVFWGSGVHVENEWTLKFTKKPSLIGYPVYVRHMLGLAQTMYPISPHFIDYS